MGLGGLTGNGWEKSTNQVDNIKVHTRCSVVLSVYGWRQAIL
jgi:hypothetical protein